MEGFQMFGCNVRPYPLVRAQADSFTFSAHKDTCLNEIPKPLDPQARLECPRLVARPVTAPQTGAGFSGFFRGGKKRWKNPGKKRHGQNAPLKSIFGMPVQQQSCPRVGIPTTAAFKPSPDLYRDDATSEVSTQTHTDFYVNKLVTGLKDILQSGLYSDVKFLVKGQEFKAHKIILAAHSTAFAIMMEAENPAIIDDVDPNIFKDVLYFMYAGSTEKFNPENTIEMYKVSKKYQISELSSSCVKYMVENLSVDNFCDVMSLSLEYSDDRLSDVAKQYFLQNSADVAETAKWFAFLKDNTGVCNSLFVEALKSKKRKLM